MAKVDRFTKSALVASKGFKPIERDILSIRLEDDKTYSKAEVDKIIKNFKGGL